MSDRLAIPTYFGDEARPVFGLYHPIAAGTTAPFAVLICSAWGREEVCAHRTMRWLAQGYAELGLPTLRFDYDGCGNSAGDDLDPGRVQAWQASTEAAVDHVLRLSGARQVVLVGVRMGALMAAMVASERRDVRALVAINPVCNGRAFVRELKFIQANSATATPPSESHLLENEGSFMDEQTVADVSRLDLLSLTAPPAPAVLLVNRQDLPTSPAWARHLRDQGVSVDEVSMSGYAEMMLPPHKTVLPAELAQLTGDWLSGMAKGEATGGQVAPVVPHLAEVRFGQGGAALREQAFYFGHERPLFGILSEPVSDRGDAPAPLGPHDKLIILIGEGANRLTGPNRIFVPLAQRWAAMGHRVLRFDLSGIGESPTKPGEPDNLVYSRPAMDDLAQAIQLVQARYGARDVVLLGLCSGAFHAFQAAAGDMPVSKVVLINTFVFFWEEGLSDDYPEDLVPSKVAGEVVRYRSSMRSMDKWLTLLSSSVGRRRLREVAHNYVVWSWGKVVRTLARWLRFPLDKDLHTVLMRIARKGIGMHFIFAQSDPGHMYMSEHAARAQARLIKSGDMTLELIPHANHTFSTHRSRSRLLSVLQHLIEAD